MAKFGDAIRRLREDHRMTQEELCEKTGLSIDTIWRVEKMDSSKVRGTTYRLLATAFGLTTAELDREWRSGRIPQLQGDPHRGVPILSEIPASNGTNVEAAAYDQGIGDGYVSRAVIGIEDPTAYIVYVRGDSMSPTLTDGDMVACSPGAVREKGFEDGSIYAIRFGSELDDESTIKRVRVLNDNEIELLPDNARHRRRIVRLDHIVGAAKAVRRLSNLE